ncbi:MAG: CrcB family protein [Planctomycetota bacterium]
MGLSWLTIAAVAAGGAIGALARLGVVWLVHRDGLVHHHSTILAINAAGCFALGVLAGWISNRPSTVVQAFVATGLLGSLTTFSTFAVDALKLMHAGKPVEAVAYMTGSVVIGLGAAAAGYALTVGSA